MATFGFQFERLPISRFIGACIISPVLHIQSLYYINPTKTPYDIDITQWYTVALIAITALLIVFYILGISIGFRYTYAIYHFLKHVFYPRVHKYIRGTTRYHALLVLALLVGNVICLMDNRTKAL